MKKFIIPAAGFGKRVGEPAAKELLFFDGEVKPLLYYCLDLALRYGFRPVVISRHSKTELNEFLYQVPKDYNLEVCLIESSEEWPDTVRQSESFWGDKNILVLPDSRFSPPSIVNDLDRALDMADISVAGFEVSDFNTWGVVGKVEKQFFMCEKPQKALPGPACAWGLIGFRKKNGADLFEKLHLSSQNNEPQILSTSKVRILNISDFKDIARDANQLKPTPSPE